MQLLLLGGLWWTSPPENVERQLLAPNLNAWVCAILATGEQPLTREFLADLLWPKLEGIAAASALRQRLHRLKQTPLTAGLEVGPKLLRWMGQSDVTALRRCYAASDWAGVIALYQGPLLQGVPFPVHQSLEDWLESQRTKLHADYRHALWQHAHQLEASGERQAVVALLHRAAQLDPDASDLVSELARHYLALHDLQRASQVIVQHRNHLEHEVGEPLPAKLVSLLKEAETALNTPSTDSAALTTLPPLWGIPTFLTSFVGRATERRAALSHLTAADPARRWLTIVGVGGVGKTRLATELALACAEQTRRGVYFFSLAPLEGEPQIIEAILQAFGEALEGESPPRTRLFAALKKREVLLVLDNFEHLHAVADLLPALLAACPQVRLLVTSRQRLHFQAEEVLRLGPLGADMQSAAQGGVQLFMDRARRADLTFDGAGAQGTISRIVERCEGLPLAIELAAAWIGEYSPEVILSQIQQSWDFLQTSLRDVSERHRSLRAVFEYSWQVLPPELRAAYINLAVFRSPFNAVAATSLGVSELDLQLLEQRSLINAASSGLFAWHENLRTYALEQLGDQLTAQLDLHLEYFLTLAEAAAPQLKGREQARILRELAAVYPDLRSALAYAVRAGQIESGLRLSGALHWFWYVRGFLEEGLSWLDLFLEKAERQVQLNGSVSYALALRCAGGLSRDRSLFEAAGRRLAGAMRLYRALDDVSGQAHTAHMQGVLERDLGHYPESRQAFSEANVLWEQIGDQQGLATTLNDLGILSAYEDDGVAARAFFERSLVLKREVGDIQGVAYALNNIANVIDDLDEILALDAESLRLKQELGDVQGIAVSFGNYGHTFLQLNRLDEAAAQYIQAIRLFRQIGSLHGAAELLGSVTTIAVSSGNLVAGLDFANVTLHLAELTEIKLRPSQLEQAQHHRQRTLLEIPERPLPDWATNLGHALEAAVQFLESCAATQTASPKIDSASSAGSESDMERLTRQLPA